MIELYEKTAFKTELKHDRAIFSQYFFPVVRTSGKGSGTAPFIYGAART
jgi:hypothetical protein